MPTRFVPKSVAILPGARPFSPSAALTAARATGAGPILNAIAFDAPPPLDTVKASISATPTFAMSAAVIWAVRCSESDILVGRAAPFHRSVVPFEKLEPVTSSENEAAPAFAVFGDRDVIDGLTEADVDESGFKTSQTPRPCVAARKIRVGRCRTTASTTTRGRPALSVDQDAPPSVVAITPASVPM